MTHTRPPLFVRGISPLWSVLLAYSRAGRARDLDGHVNQDNPTLVSQPKSNPAAMLWPRMLTGLILALAGRTPAKPQPQGRPRFVAVRPHGEITKKTAFVLVTLHAASFFWLARR